MMIAFVLQLVTFLQLQDKKDSRHTGLRTPEGRQTGSKDVMQDLWDLRLLPTPMRVDMLLDFVLQLLHKVCHSSCRGESKLLRRQLRLMVLRMQLLSGHHLEQLRLRVRLLLRLFRGRLLHLRVQLHHQDLQLLRSIFAWIFCQVLLILAFLQTMCALRQSWRR